MEGILFVTTVANFLSDVPLGVYISDMPRCEKEAPDCTPRTVILSLVGVV